MTVYVFPGQGSQKLQMGKELFDEFPELLAQADKILGYSLRTLCELDPLQQLNNTKFTQPALYVVNALSYFKKINDGKQKPSYFVGHSLGEYNALLAAGVFDFETGLRLVQERARLMSQAQCGKMAAVLGLDSDKVLSVLKDNRLDLTIANYNSYTQQVISGSAELIDQASQLFKSAGAKLYLPLKVSGAFHSAFMDDAQIQFATFLNQFKFSQPHTPVISNRYAQIYPVDNINLVLAEQINHSVYWLQSIQYLLDKGENIFEEIGPGQVLTGLICKIQQGS